jgi:uncharacterized membrane protein (DUF2068 family)
MMSYLPPEQRKKYTPIYSKIEVSPERGGCLTAWLVVSSIFAGIAVIVLLQAFDLVQRTRSNEFTPALIALGVLIFINIVGLVGIWQWKRWGVYIVAFSSIASPIVELMFLQPTASDFIAPVIQLAILYFLVHDKWEDFN